VPKVEFSSMLIKNLQPDSKPVEFFDQGRDHGDGSFGIRVSPKGKKTWFMMYKNEAGKIKRFTLGTYPALSLKDARAKANNKMTEVREGADPMGELTAHKEAPTMTDLWELFVQHRSNLAKPKAARTINQENRQWKNEVEPILGNVKVKSVAPHHLSGLLQKKATKYPVAANRLHSFLQILFKPALANGWIEIHPLHWIDKPGGSEPPRRRILVDDEIRTLWPLFDTLKDNARDILKLGLLCGQRPGEIQSMRWEDVDLDDNLWIIRNTKSGNDHLVPLSRQMKNILKVRNKGNNWVFPSAYNPTRSHKGKSRGHTTTLKADRKKLQDTSGITGWTSHDLRRTARTLMGRLNIKPHIRERIINHSQGKIVDTYDQYDYLQEKADGLQKLGNEIDRVIGIKEPAKIIELKTA